MPGLVDLFGQFDKASAEVEAKQKVYNDLEEKASIAYADLVGAINIADKIRTQLTEKLGSSLPSVSGRTRQS